MAEDMVRQVEPSDPAVDVTSTGDSAASPAAAPAASTPSPLEDRVAQLESDIAQRDSLLAQYQAALGQAVTQRTGAAPAAAPVESKFDSDSKQFVSSVAKKEIDTAIARLLTRAEAQQKLGSDKELFAAAQREFSNLKINPVYAGLSEEVLEAIAVDKARASVTEARYHAAKTEYAKANETASRRNDASSTNIPSTASPRSTSTTTEPDADLRAYMEDPDNIEFFRRWIGNRSVNPLSDEIVREFGRDWKAKDLYKTFAERAVRKGFRMHDSTHGIVEVRAGREQ